MVPHRRRPDGGCAFGPTTLVAEAGEERYARGAEPGTVECPTDGP
ncbi:MULTISPECIES: hypothetical protein [Streptomyces]|uniref:Uncharacterized protein n=1 Tax=Streptomyces flaveolus TaxID=67297 RepID=A0ABV3AEI6_9ACTN|nr:MULTISPECIES: hypothetical protein [Streptomyces]